MLYVLNILIALLIGLYSSRRWRRLGFRFTSPAGLAAFVWCFVWAVHVIDLFGYFPVGTEAMVYSIIPIIAMFVGEQIAYGLKVRTSGPGNDVGRLGTFLKVNALLALVFGLAAFLSVYLIFGNPLQGGVGAEVKLERTETGVSMLRGSPLYALAQYVVSARAFVYVALLSLVPLWTVNRALAVKIGVVVAAAGLLMDISWGSRTLILDLLIFAVVFLGLTRRQRRLTKQPRHKIALGAVVLAIVAGLYVGADKITESTRPGRSAEVLGVEIPYSLNQFLVYYTASFVLFDQTLNENPERTFGLMSGGGVLSNLYLLRVYRNDELAVYDVMERWESEYPEFRSGGDMDRGNTYTWLRYLYSDFGVAGLIMVPLVLGLLSGRSAKRIAGSCDIRLADYAVLAFMFYTAARSPIILALRPEYFTLALLLVFLIHRLTLSRRQPATVGTGRSMSAPGTAP